MGKDTKKLTRSEMAAIVTTAAAGATMAGIMGQGIGAAIATRDDDRANSTMATRTSPEDIASRKITQDPESENWTPAEIIRQYELEKNDETSRRLAEKSKIDAEIQDSANKGGAVGTALGLAALPGAGAVMYVAERRRRREEASKQEGSPERG